MDTQKPITPEVKVNRSRFMPASMLSQQHEPSTESTAATSSTPQPPSSNSSHPQTAETALQNEAQTSFSSAVGLVGALPTPLTESSSPPPYSPPGPTIEPSSNNSLPDLEQLLISFDTTHESPPDNSPSITSPSVQQSTTLEDHTSTDWTHMRLSLDENKKTIRINMMKSVSAFLQEVDKQDVLLKDTLKAKEQEWKDNDAVMAEREFRLVREEQVFEKRKMELEAEANEGKVWKEKYEKMHKMLEGVMSGKLV
ncbi:hypothetical protein BJ508DRAFT_417806 [Ascobolus immersus RN42]|uniref:Uncharacterized protein n=1 Tax=Ascobolus immersus RN42 TaxID=1160509 RepID=A0A3N4HU10_ASCIM|nr:hypothetical protein BJ508DRAFT_417806 [Ascobolus immersus RN42]